MNTLTLQATFGGLLCGLSKIVFRTGQNPQNFRFLLPHKEEWAAVHECMQAQHTSPAACCVCFARSLSPVSDAPEMPDTEQLPLDSIFTHLNGEHPDFRLEAAPQDGNLRFPSHEIESVSRPVYEKIVQELNQQLSCLEFSSESVSPLLGLLEHWCSTVPASTAHDRDISLLDDLKLTAALAACAAEYALENGMEDLHADFVEHGAAFRKREAFLLYTADFSRIQRFIYTVHTEGALRSLRSRSFFLELLMEHYLDELLAFCGMTRANVIYSGGGHCYVLLPNTASVRRKLAEWNQRFNQWLNQQFGAQLFLANGWAACCADTLCNVPAESSPYKKLFRQVNAAAEQHKQHPYSAGDLRALNRFMAYPDGTRECKICGASSMLDKGNLCPWCGLFARLSGKIQKQTVYVISRVRLPKTDFELPSADGSSLYAAFLPEQEAFSLQEESSAVVRLYAKNQVADKLYSMTGLYVGDYAASNDMQKFSGRSDGIPRIAVCRMDVDNLGQAFIAGFECADIPDAVQRMKYVNLSRAAAFSRQMSLFFKYHINGILDGLFVSIVYAGGDDVFLVGAWNDVLEGAQRIHKNLTRYSCGALTISAGIGLFDDHFPIRAAAEKTAEMEEEAKKLPNKNAVSLFDAIPDHTYSWDMLSNKVLGEKLACLNEFFENQTGDEQKRGNSMLYNLLTLLRMTKNSRINYARCAYLLARLEPGKDEPDKYAVYKKFADSFISWANREEDRRQLITAIYIYIYQNRKGN